MTKAELIEMGVAEEKIRDFQKVYWDDVRKTAKRMNLSTADEVRNAITAMIRLIPDIEKLKLVLQITTGQYAKLQKEQVKAKSEELTETGDPAGGA